MLNRVTAKFYKRMYSEFLFDNANSRGVAVCQRVSSADRNAWIQGCGVRKTSLYVVTHHISLNSLLISDYSCGLHHKPWCVQRRKTVTHPQHQ
jgi:hypothetical protein